MTVVRPPKRGGAKRLAVRLLDCSVVIPTFHRDESLRRLLNDLAGQSLGLDRFEVIVVDDARSETTPSLIEAVTRRHPGFRLRLLGGGCRGPAAARNQGWRAAVGEIVAFIDDDAYPASSDWLWQGMESLRLSGAPGAGGKVLVPVEARPTDFQRNVKRLELGYFLTCNAFYRRSALEAVDGFDERFRAPYREDSDLHFRVEEALGPMVTTDKAVVIHPAPRGAFGISLRLQRYSMYNALIYEKHRRRSRRELEIGPPLHYYAMVLLAAGALGILLAGNPRLALCFMLAWVALEAWFFAKRAAGTSREPMQLLDLAFTSLLIPPLSIYWRLRGAVRFRVLFI